MDVLDLILAAAPFVVAVGKTTITGNVGLSRPSESNIAK